MDKHLPISISRTSTCTTAWSWQLNKFLFILQTNPTDDNGDCKAQQACPAGTRITQSKIKFNACESCGENRYSGTNSKICILQEQAPEGKYIKNINDKTKKYEFDDCKNGFSPNKGYRSKGWSIEKYCQENPTVCPTPTSAPTIPTDCKHICSTNDPYTYSNCFTKTENECVGNCLWVPQLIWNVDFSAYNVDSKKGEVFTSHQYQKIYNHTDVQTLMGTNKITSLCTQPIHTTTVAPTSAAHIVTTTMA